MVYEFKRAAHIPKGVTANGVMEERERIKQEYGKSTIEHSTNAVLSEPDKYPNLRSFAPEDPEEALRLCVADGIRHAYASVIPVRVTDDKSNLPAREVRVLYAVPDEDGDLVYEPLSVVRESDFQRKYLIAQLRRDAKVFSDKLQDVLAEVEEAS